MNKPNEKLKALAVEILGSQEDLPSEKFGSVIMILMMIAIIVNGIRVLQECNKNKKEEDKVALYKKHIRDISTYRGWFTKMRLRKLIRRELGSEDYKLYGRALCTAILDKGERITDEEVSMLLEAANV